MSITRYIAEAGLTASTPAVALQRLRNRRIVNRYDGSTVTDNASSITGVNNDNNVTLSSAVTIPTGYNVFIDKTIVIQSDFNTNTNGSHLSFFNCTVILEAAGGNPGPLTVSTGGLNNTAVESGVDTGQASGRSLNFYGSSLIINNINSFANCFQMFSDFMDSNMTFAQSNGTVGVNIPLPSFVVGSRVINGTFYASAKHANAVFEIYGIPDIVEGLDIFRMSLEYTGQAGEGSLMFVEPNFSSPENQRRWRTQSPGGDTLMSSVGFYSPLDNTLANAFTTDNSATAYFRTASGAAGGQLYNYYAWRPSFFSDVGLTNPIPAVRIRSTSNLPLNGTATGLNSGETNLSASFSGTSSTINQTGLATVVINEFVSDANGLPIADANSRVSTNGGTTFFDGQWYDWMRFSRVNTASATTGGEALATNFSGQDFPNGVIAVPIQRFAASAYNQFAATYEARSYTHDVNTGVITENGIIGTAAGNQPSNVPVLIEDQTTVAAANAAISTTTEAAADALLNTASDKTPQNLHDWMRADWSQYNTDLLVEASGDILSWTNGSVTINSGSGASAIAADGAVTLFNVSNVVVGPDADSIKNLSVTDNVNLNTSWTGGSISATGLIDADSQTITNATVNGGSGANVLGTISNVVYTSTGGVTVNGDVSGGSITGSTTLFDGSTVSGNTSITATSTTAGATVRFNNDFNVSNCTLSSADNIRFDDGGSGIIGDNVTCSTTAADGIVVMRSNGSGDNFEVTAPRMNTYDVTASRGLVILNGDIRVDLVGAVGNPTITVAQLFGGTDNVPGTAGQITLTSDAPVTIQTNDTTRFTYGTSDNVTIEAIPAGLATNTWSIPTPVAGRYAVTSTIGGVNAVIQAPTDFAAGATVSGTISSSNYSTTDSITMWVKYDSQFTAGSLQYYLENAQTLNFSSTDGTVLGFSPGSAEVAAFAIDEQADVPSNVSFTASADGNNALVEITNSSNASLTLTFNTSLQLIADIANSSAYFDSWFNNRGTTTAPIVVYGQGYVSNIDASRITFESGNLSGGFRLQHTTGNWSNSSSTGTFASSRTGAPEVVSVIAGLALVNPTDIRNAMDSSVAAGRVERIANAAGWLADDASLLPSVNPYVDATDYEGNL